MRTHTMAANSSNSVFQHITLTENDVPGAILSKIDISAHSVLQLKRWLKCRGLKISGNKAELVKRIEDAITTGRSRDIDVNIDNGKWFEIKAKEQQATTSGSSSNVPILPITGWKSFSSSLIPRFFNEGHLHHYFHESISFVNDDSIHVSVSTRNNNDVQTSKPLDRGMLYFTSGHVQDLQDHSVKDYYFLKACVMASFQMSQFYNVNVTLSSITGYIIDTSCECVASSMGRCSHVAGTLLALLDYIDKFGYGPKSVTSLPCLWNKGRQMKKTPKRIFEANYSVTVKKVKSLIAFNPMPKSVQLDLKSETNKLVSAFGTNHISNRMFTTLCKYKYNDYEVGDDRKEILSQLRCVLLDSLHFTVKLKSDKNSDRFPAQLTETQGTSEWIKERRVRITASEAKAFSHAVAPSRIFNLLNNKLWHFSDIHTASINYGKEHEDKARIEFETLKQATSPGYKAIKTGLWSHQKSPELAASPDALFIDPNIQSASGPTAKFGIIEIKCPFNLKDVSPEHFDSHLSATQRNAFCLKRNSDGLVKLKTTHSYYFQIQMQLGLLCLVYADFVVWSPKGIFYERIELYIEFWNNLKEKLTDFHHCWLCPEYFEMRIPRNLMPVMLQKH